MFWTISAWIIALLSLVANFLQLRTNSELKKMVAKNKQVVGDNSTGNQQNHSGNGHNINVGGNANIN